MPDPYGPVGAAGEEVLRVPGVPSDAGNWTLNKKHK